MVEAADNHLGRSNRTIGRTARQRELLQILGVRPVVICEPVKESSAPGALYGGIRIVVMQGVRRRLRGSAEAMSCCFVLIPNYFRMAAKDCLPPIAALTFYVYGGEML